MTRVRRAHLARVAAVIAGLWLALELAALPGPPGAAAGLVPLPGPDFSPSSCVPRPPYRHCLRYWFTGDDQVLTVPGGVRRIEVLEWGAGGGATARSSRCPSARAAMPAGPGSIRTSTAAAASAGTGATPAAAAA